MNNRFFLKLCVVIPTMLLISRTTLCDPITADSEKKQTVYEMYEVYKEEFPTVRDMTPQEAMNLMAKGHVVFVDVRKPAERAVSRLPYSVTEEEFKKSPTEFGGKTIVAHCTISYRSGKFALNMEEKGIRVYNLRGGILAWVFEGGKVFDENGETNRVHVYGEKWNYLPEGYEAVKFGFFEKYF